MAAIAAAGPAKVSEGTAAKHISWGTANFVVIALALIPVLWLVSLSFKTPAAVTDPSFWPS